MIPASIYQQTPSDGEIEIFARLRDDPETKDWIVLHSLDIANHTTRVAGELDFVVLIPGRGVVCLEVKAARSITRHDGLWYYGRRADGDPRGPFKQVETAMYSLRNQVVTKFLESRSIVWAGAVVFPFVDFDEKSVEWQEWQVVDRRIYGREPLSRSILRVLAKAREHLVARGVLRDGAGMQVQNELSLYQDIASYLRPDFEFREALKSAAKRREQEVIRYTSEQFGALDAMDANPRVLFKGPAGTGKTLLALEAARRSHAGGRRVLMVCFNRLLGRWLEDLTADLRPRVIARNLHRHMQAMAGQEGLEDERMDDQYFQVQLPTRAIDALLQKSGEGAFDELIVDEAPDLMKDNYLDFLDLSLRGGLSAGRWRIFGDFEKQAIYGSGSGEAERLLTARAGTAFEYALRVNCRNTPRIADYVHLLGALRPGYSRILRPDDGISPDILVYISQNQQREQLTEALETLYRDGFGGNDIVILSPRSEANQAASAITQSPWRERLQPARRLTEGHVGYGTIHAFKGMEAPAVIVTDIERIQGEEATSLLYVAITRALHRLTVLVSETARKQIAEMLITPRGGQSQ